MTYTWGVASINIEIVFCVSNGRAVHYNGSSLLQWRSVRLDICLNAGDIAGIGWERQGEAPSALGQSAKGVVYFTYNGRRLGPTIDEVSGAMWPVIHIQKKVDFIYFCMLIIDW